MKTGQPVTEKQGQENKDIKNWAEIPEKKGLWGMRLMLRVYSLLGRRVFMLLLIPVILVFYLTSKSARAASKDFLQRVRAERQRRGMDNPPLSSYRHFYSFGLTLLDKISSWQGHLRLGHEVMYAKGAEEVLAAHQGGLLLMVSHLGDIELCRALVTAGKMRQVTALVFHANAERFAKVMREFAPNAELNLLALKDFGPELAIKVKDLIDQGHIIAIAADRLAVPGKTSASERTVRVPFMGVSAPFAQGPWILASILKVPVLAMFALREHGKIKIYAHHLSDCLNLPRKGREEGICKAVTGYAEILEEHALNCPYEWFNFFDFFRLEESAASAEGAEQKSTEQKTAASKQTAIAKKQSPAKTPSSAMDHQAETEPGTSPAAHSLSTDTDKTENKTESKTEDAD